MLRLGLAVGIWLIWEPAVGREGGCVDSVEVFSSCIRNCFAILL